MTNDSSSNDSFTDDTHLGRVALRVGSPNRVVPFYRDAVDLVIECERDGSRVVLSAGGTPVVAPDENSDTLERDRRRAKLFHLVVRTPDCGVFGDMLAHVRARASDTSATLSDAPDHPVSEVLYSRDPGGDGVEAYRDRPCEEWPWANDRRVPVDTLPLDLGALTDDAVDDEVVPAGTDLGHIHLEVTNVPRSQGFYVGALGVRVHDGGYPGAAFAAAGEYHHHVSSNNWDTRSVPVGGSRGAEWSEIVVPGTATLDAVRESLVDVGHEIERDGSDESGSGGGDATDTANVSIAAESLVLSDPGGIGVRVVRSC